MTGQRAARGSGLRKLTGDGSAWKALVAGGLPDVHITLLSTHPGGPGLCPCPSPAQFGPVLLPASVLLCQPSGPLPAPLTAPSGGAQRDGAQHVPDGIQQALLSNDEVGKSSTAKQLRWVSLQRGR